MRLALLTPSAEGSNAPFAALDPECDPSRFAPEHQWTHLSLKKATAVQTLLEAHREGFDVFVNLCDGAWDEDRAGIEVTQALEQLGVAFTGAGSRGYDPSRLAMKMAAHSAGVSVPPFVEARTPRDVQRAHETLRFPLIVKHPRGYGSVGLTPRSRVTTPADLSREAATLIERHGAALIEEFVEGREFTVLVAEGAEAPTEPLVLMPVEFRFPTGESFKHFELKWESHATMETCVVSDPSLERALRRAAAAVWVAIEGSGYGRFDFRMDAAGEIYFLEINPNCGIFYPLGQYGSADTILDADPLGHRGFLEHMLTTALRRRDEAVRPWEHRFSRERGFELVASAPIGAGEVAVRYEGEPQRLVSRRHAEERWPGAHAEWFHRYAWPLSAEVFAMWSQNPEDWRPLNHSCDPNTELLGLDLVARRPIAADEALSVDYATFCGPDMTPFVCGCGAPGCRREISGRRAQTDQLG